MNENEIEYANLGDRFTAVLIDSFIILIVEFILHYLSTINLYYFSVINLILILIFIGYDFYFLKIYNATPGKIIMKLKVVKFDNSKIEWKQIILRCIFNIAYNILNYIAMISGVLQGNNNDFSTLSWFEQLNYIDSFNPVLVSVLLYLIITWLFISMISIIINKQHRAIHDLIAGTVVVKTKKELK